MNQTFQRIDFPSRAATAHLAAGSTHTCGIRADHTLWCWGEGKYGALGQGDRRQRNTPTQVGTSIDWASISAGHLHTCAIRTHHTLWCWGSNDVGQLGLGDTRNRLYPRQV